MWINKMQLSKCCKAPLDVEGDVTHYYVCSKCGRPV